jgi:NAD(P)-dependent dehydrogenase (short-subunit alcohol dehydrogenase family)
MRGLQNWRVLITGGASGIGAATVARFLDQDARLIVLDRDEAGCHAIQTRHPLLADVVVADVSDHAAVGDGRSRRSTRGWAAWTCSSTTPASASGTPSST